MASEPQSVQANPHSPEQPAPRTGCAAASCHIQMLRPDSNTPHHCLHTRYASGRVGLCELVYVDATTSLLRRPSWPPRAEQPLESRSSIQPLPPFPFQGYVSQDTTHESGDDRFSGQYLIAPSPAPSPLHKPASLRLCFVPHKSTSPQFPRSFTPRHQLNTSRSHPLLCPASPPPSSLLPCLSSSPRCRWLVPSPRP